MLLSAISPEFLTALFRLYPSEAWWRDGGEEWRAGPWGESSGCFIPDIDSPWSGGGEAMALSPNLQSGDVVFIWTGAVAGDAGDSEPDSAAATSASICRSFCL